MKALLDLANLMRRVGLRVSASEVADCLMALSLPGISPRDYQTVIACTMAKERLDKRTLTALLDTLPLEESSGETACLSDGRGLGKSGVGPASPGLLDALGHWNGLQLDALARRAALSLGDIRADELPDLRELVSRAMVKMGWYPVLRQLQKRDDPEARTKLDAMNVLQAAIAREVHREVIRQWGEAGAFAVIRQTDPRSVRFSLLETEEARLIDNQVKKLASKIASRYGRRDKPSPSGHVDMARTVRDSVHTRGWVLKLGYKKKRKTVPRLAMLVDVSGSVRPYSRFFLTLLQAVKRRAAGARCFVFIDDVTEITDEVDPMCHGEIMLNEDILSRISITNNSDYGRVFHIFAERYLESLSPRTVLLIVGDGRNNSRPPETYQLKRIADRVDRVIWFTPLAPDRWLQEDCVLPLYAAYCKSVHTCGSYEELRRAVEELQ
ncbi:MAG: VWA domain-containing protein [Bacillota bacterium]